MNGEQCDFACMHTRGSSCLLQYRSDWGSLVGLGRIWTGDSINDWMGKLLSLIFVIQTFVRSSLSIGARMILHADDINTRLIPIPMTTIYVHVSLWNTVASHTVSV